MKKRLEKLQEQQGDARSLLRIKNKKTAGGIMLCVIVFVLAMVLSKGTFSKTEPVGSGSDEKAKVPNVNEVVTEDDSWKLILVNTNNILPKDFTVSLQEIKGGKVDVRIAKPLLKMIEDAKADGVTLTVCSAYRNVPKQKDLFAQEIGRYREQGYNEEESTKLAKRYVNPPGASEHHTGLAIDFLTDSYTSLDEGFGDTRAYGWLSVNARNYGFIERYPSGKEEVTGIFWEPWHYRYVGVQNAKDILETGEVLEEYLTQDQ